MACYKRILGEFNTVIPNKLIEYDLADKFKFVALDTDIISKRIGVINKNARIDSSNMVTYNQFHKTSETDVIELELNISSSYPFHAPNVLVRNGCDRKTEYIKWCSNIINKANNKNYLDNNKLFNAWAFTIIKYPKLYFFANTIPTNKTCLCCESIICADRWCPSMKLSDILCEYVVRRNFQIYLGNLIQRWISSIFHNDKWNLPEEIICEIIKWLS